MRIRSNSKKYSIKCKEKYNNKCKSSPYISNNFSNQKEIQNIRKKSNYAMNNSQESATKYKRYKKIMDRSIAFAYKTYKVFVN